MLQPHRQSPPQAPPARGLAIVQGTHSIPALPRPVDDPSIPQPIGDASQSLKSAGSSSFCTCSHRCGSRSNAPRSHRSAAISRRSAATGPCTAPPTQPRQPIDQTSFARQSDPTGGLRFRRLNRRFSSINRNIRQLADLRKDQSPANRINRAAAPADARISIYCSTAFCRPVRSSPFSMNRRCNCLHLYVKASSRAADHLFVKPFHAVFQQIFIGIDVLRASTQSGSRSAGSGTARPTRSTAVSPAMSASNSRTI